MPSQVSLPPGVELADEQDRKKDADHDHARHFDRPHADRPQVDEDDLHVEGDEQQRVEVEGEAEADQVSPIVSMPLSYGRPFWGRARRCVMSHENRIVPKTNVVAANPNPRT